MVDNFTRIGSISSGTMQPEDLIRAFMDALDDIREEIASPGPTTQSADETEWRKGEVSRIDNVLGRIEQNMGGLISYYETKDCMDDLNDLTELLEGFAPPMCYFGTHEAVNGGWWEDSSDDFNDDFVEEHIPEASPSGR